MKKGFTLIELMIVIAIIALLAAVALPKFSSASESAKIANVQGNLANLRTAIAIHYAKERVYPNDTDDIDGDGNIGGEFANYYSKSTMPETPAGENVESPSNAVKTFDSSGHSGDDWTNPVGGWLYDPSVGLIYAYLPKSAYGGNESWKQQ